MTEREEIREEFNKLAHYFMGKHFGKDISVKQFNDRIDETLTNFQSIGVVIKVDRELPQIIDDEIERINRVCKTHRDKIEKSYYDAQIELINDYGYEAVEPLVKE